MSWMFNCWGAQDEWDQKELCYIREVNKYKESAIKAREEQETMKQHFSQEIVEWQMKESEYLERINELQNQLHQNEVVMQQYKISEGNFQIDRQQLQDNQKQIERYEKTIATQQKQVRELIVENKKYLETILDLTRAAIGNSDFDRDMKKSERLNGNNFPHITESVLV